MVHRRGVRVAGVPRRATERAACGEILAGAVAPLVAVALLNAWDSTVPVWLYLLGMCMLTVIAVLAARETRGRALEPATAAAAVLQVTR